MKVSIDVDGLKAEASTDYAPSWGASSKEAEAIRLSMFARLTTEARAVAKELIAAKYTKEEN